MNEKRVLILTSVASMVQQFLLPNIDLLLGMGYQVDVACNFIEGNTCSPDKIIELKENLTQQSIRYFQIDFSRNPFNLISNIRAYGQVMKLIQQYQYHFVHCHSPIGGVCGRLASHHSKVKVIYTAHGFHFYQGAPLLNWLVFYPIEKYLARYTDLLITINHEDYSFACKQLKARQIVYIPGIGINLERFELPLSEIISTRKQLAIPDNCIVLLSVGELNKNKNHAVIIRAMAKILKDNIYYLIAGKGDELSRLQKIVNSYNLGKRVIFLGFRKDINMIYSIADIFCFPSLREGLSVSLMEAMVNGLPVICSRIRGNIDLIIDGQNGLLCAPEDVSAFASAIDRLSDDIKMRLQMAERHTQILSDFSVQCVMNRMKDIYEQLDGGAI